ncbi:MAG: tyrosine-type recombinase/integrase [Alphaproteobacteria bacterium]|uniref:tyrosine-type recombinase/integrase n=1 Tax=Rhizorhabdus sp. TaxID=1968843 RepID=UPI001ACDE64F|nr:tyrosine-type recombinase/integrase [Rhizorhabdus sp.]MBN9529895.1 tyrosine-type recombinase/integrase [Alphaproteobacteria bacterium]MBP8231561.1 tyrosine-type recombinase/integrase [Rhizorhabdus sp.]
MTDETLPALAATPTELSHLETLAEKAREFARRAQSANTRRAYGADWRHFSAWCASKGLSALPPSPPTIGLYLTACATGRAGEQISVGTLERRLAGLSWHYTQRGLVIDRRDPHIAQVLAGIRRTYARPSVGKEPVLAEDVIRMAEIDGRDLRGLRDRSILLLGYAGGLRRSEIVGLDVGRGETEEGVGWLALLEEGMLLTIKGKGERWREVEIGRGSSELSCPVRALETWLHLGRIAHGPVFRRISQDGMRALPDRLSGRHVARLVKRTALAAGIRGDASEGERSAMFAGHSLRAGFASSDIDERYAQKQMGHASAEMTRRYQRRRGRFRVNMTKAAGL